MKKCDIDCLQYIQKDQLQIACQLYTNRALCNHYLNRHLDVVDDTGFVINKLDPKNAKAFYRRGVALARMGDPEKALTDLEQTTKLDPSNTPAKEELSAVLGAVIEIRRKQKSGEQKKEVSKDAAAKEPEEKKMGKVSEIGKSVKVEVLAEDQKVTKEAEPAPRKKGFKGKMISEEEINKAAARAAQSLSPEYLQRPKTAYAFENVWRSYKQDYAVLYKYMKV